MTKPVRRLAAAIGVSAIVLAPTVFGRDTVAAQGVAGSAAGDRTKFPGAYELVTIEIKDPATGRWIPDAGFNSNGYIIYADTGHMGVHIQPKVRKRFGGNLPTGDEAQDALRGYTAYFGSFTVNDKEHDKFVVHQRFGQINPGGDVEVRRYYDFETTPNGSIRLHPDPAARGRRREGTRRRGVWSGSGWLDAPLSAEAKKFVGFWRLLYTDTYRTKDGKEVFHGDKSREPRRHVVHHLRAVGSHDGPPDEQGRADEVRRRSSRRPTRRSGVPELQRLLRTLHHLRESEPAVRVPQPAGHDGARRVQRAEALLSVHRQRAAAGARRLRSTTRANCHRVTCTGRSKGRSTDAS